MWTKFMDMHSGGGCKFKPFEYIYVEGKDEADCLRIFEKETGRDPYHVTCDCCGEDYCVSTAETLAEATGFERHRGWGATIPLDEYISRVTVKVYPLKQDMTYEDSVKDLMAQIGKGGA